MTTFQSKVITFQSANGYLLGKGKHFNIAVYNDKVYLHAGDLGESSSQEMFTYDWSTDTWTQIQTTCGSAYSGWNGTLTDTTGLRPSQPDDGAWFWDSNESRFWWLFGGGQLAYGGTILATNQCGDGLPTNSGEGLTQSYLQTATRWRGYRMMQFEPIEKRWYDVAFTENLSGFSTMGNIYGADNVSRGNAFDSSARKIFRIYQNGSQTLAVFDLAAKTVVLYTMALLADGTYFNEPENLTLSYAHNSAVVDPDTGYLYAVIPHSGRLLKIDTRGTPLQHEGGQIYRLPMYLLDNPITPIPSWRAAVNVNDFHYVGSDHCVLRVWKGGLLYIIGDVGAIDGRVNGAWWRSLTNVDTSKWIPMNFPSNFAGSAWTTNTDSSGSLYAIGTHIDPPAFPEITMRIWRITP